MEKQKLTRLEDLPRKTKFLTTLTDRQGYIKEKFAGAVSVVFRDKPNSPKLLHPDVLVVDLSL